MFAYFQAKPHPQLPAQWVRLWHFMLLTMVFLAIPQLAQQTVGAQPPRMELDDAEITSIHDVATKIERLFSRQPSHIFDTTWSLHKIDAQPTVSVNGLRGFQIVFRRTWKEYTNPPQQRALANVSPGPFLLRDAEWEFVLFPVYPKKAGAEIQSHIPWQNSKSSFHTRNVCMGEGEGYVWFTKGTIQGQDWVRQELKLLGGDDRIQLLLDGVTIDDQGLNTANSCEFSLIKLSKQQGNRILPYIEKKIKEPLTSSQIRRVVGCLSATQTDRVTNFLLALYNSKTKHFRYAAESTLTRGQFRERAKPAYLDMLRRQSTLERGCAACVYFQWQEAIPILHQLSVNVKQPRQILTVISTRRTLEGNPIPEKILATERTLQRAGALEGRPKLTKKVNAARQLLIESDDSEVANTIAFNLAIWQGFKANASSIKQVNDVGAEILKARPRRSTATFLRGVTKNISQDQRKKLETLLTTFEIELSARP